MPWSTTNGLPYLLLLLLPNLKCHACSSQRDYMLSKLRDLEGKLSASKSVRQATDRERRLAAAAAKLKKEIPGKQAVALVAM